jgi:hypothetical protein
MVYDDFITYQVDWSMKFYYDRITFLDNFQEPEDAIDLFAPVFEDVRFVMTDLSSGHDTFELTDPVEVVVLIEGLQKSDIKWDAWDMLSQGGYDDECTGLIFQYQSDLYYSGEVTC